MSTKEEAEVSSLAEALVAFQGAVPTIGKNRTAKIKMKNGGEFSYAYADLGDIWDAIREPLKNNGLAVTQGLVGGSDGWTSIKTTVWHKSGQTFSETVEVPTSERTAQEVGSQITYFKRYALGATLGIATEVDDDGQAGNEKPTAPLKASPNKEASQAQIRLLEDLMKQDGIDHRAIDAKLMTIETSAQASDAISKMKAKLENK